MHFILSGAYKDAGAGRPDRQRGVAGPGLGHARVGRPEAFVFSPIPDGSAFPRPDGMTQRYDRMAAVLGIETTFHKLRHYSATELIAAGVDVRTVAGRLGHAGGGTTTLRSYTAWVSEADQRAATGLGTRMPVRPDPSVPVVPEREPAYLRAANELRRRIVDGELRVGGAPPSEKQVAAEFGVAVGTAHRVAASLADPASFRPHLVGIARMEAPERAGDGEGWIGDFERARNSRTQGEVAALLHTTQQHLARWRRAPGRSLLSCVEPRSPSWASSPRSWACRPGRRARWLLRTTPVRRSRPAARSVALDLDEGPQRAEVDGSEPESAATRPLRIAGARFDHYTSAVKCLDRPQLFESRPSYRLLDASLTNQCLGFGLAPYFDKLDVSESLGHELAGVCMADPALLAAPSVAIAGRLPFRDLVADPFDPQRRAVIPAITTLTIRLRRYPAEPSFLLHWRDPAKVATAGGLYDVVPAGEFQPSSVALWDRQNDFDLWRNIVREYSEELLGMPEHDGSRSRPIDYPGWDHVHAFQGRTRHRQNATAKPANPGRQASGEPGFARAPGRGRGATVDRLRRGPVGVTGRAGMGDGDFWPRPACPSLDGGGFSPVRVASRCRARRDALSHAAARPRRTWAASGPVWPPDCTEADTPVDHWAAADVVTPGG